MDMFTALADPTRRDIVELLAKSGKLPASDIYIKFNISHPAISQHLKVLKEAKLVKVEKQAQQRIYQINPVGIEELEHWVEKLSKVWHRRFDQFEKVLQKEKAKYGR
jgi:DNA-binding transcriptional ArsR family regulator